MHIKIFSLAILVLMSLSACSKKLSVLDQRTKDNYNWSLQDLKRIQFYLSEDIRLKRIASSGDTEIKNGKVKVTKDRMIDEVVIERGTPGVVIFSPKRDKLAISFDPDDDSKYLIFGPNPKLGGQYVLLASSWKKHRGVVTYGGERYRLIGSPYTKILLDIKKSEKSNTSSRRVKGREIK